MASSTNNPPAAKSKLHCRAHGEFAEWLSAAGGSLAITTYTSGKLVLVSSFDGKLHYRSIKFARPMGIALRENRLALASGQHVLVFQSLGHDRNLFQRTHKYHTGKVDTHDVAFGRRGVYFVNTRYNAIARVSNTKRFVHCWQPSFIEGVVRGDRCHLNGLGMLNGSPKMATAFCATGEKGGWREKDRFTGGILLDIEQNDIVAEGLCMPHSPRRYKRRWWLCNSGHGTLATVDTTKGECHEVCSLPGFTRGLCFVGDRALVGLSKIRPQHILDAPPVRERHDALIAGVGLVDWQSGRQTGTLEFVSGGREVYEVLFLPGVVTPGFVAAGSHTTH